MDSEHQYCQMKAMIPEIKQLYQSRRYVQCATVCERFLARHYDEIHPVHKAYLHFYFALVHDTMARETTFKHRSARLDLAEQHYRVAIDILTPIEPYNLDNILSPSSPGTEDEQYIRSRRMSNNSYRSAASSSSSLSEDPGRTWARVDSPHYDDTPSRASSYMSKKQRPAPIITINAARAYHEEQFFAELFSFLSMIQVHLCSVQELRSAAPISWLRSRSSAMSLRPESRDSSNYSENEMDQLRWARKTVNFRPRFDPTSVRKLCNEALSEL